MIWRIYRYYNPIEDKSYIGQTIKNVNRRARKGKGYRKGSPFREAIDQYGWSNFEQSILRLCTSQEEADQYERYFIEKYNSVYPNGYNLQSGGYLHKDSHKLTKKKQSDSMKEVMKNPEVRQKIANARKGKPSNIKGRKWWNNGQVNTRSKDCPGPDFVLGRLIKDYPQETRQATSNRMKGLVYWNNGKINKRSRECPGSDFVKGKLSDEVKMRKMALSKIGNTYVKGRHYYNNGQITVMRYECPEGFVLGKLKKA